MASLSLQKMRSQILSPIQKLLTFISAKSHVSYAARILRLRKPTAIAVCFALSPPKRVDFRRITIIRKNVIFVKLKAHMAFSLPCGLYFLFPLQSVGGKGRGLPFLSRRRFQVDEATLCEVLRPLADKIVEKIKQVLEQTPPELVGDIYTSGIHMTGGGSLIRGLSDLIRDEIKIPVEVVEDPIGAVSRGTGLSFKYLDSFQEGFVDADTYH